VFSFPRVTLQYANARSEIVADIPAQQAVQPNSGRRNEKKMMSARTSMEAEVGMRFEHGTSDDVWGARKTPGRTLHGERMTMGRRGHAQRA